METLERTQIYLKKSQLSRLRIFARRKNRTVSDLIRNAIDQSLEVPKNSGNRAITRDPLARLIGKGTSDDPYLSENIDYHLYGTGSKR